MSLTTPSTPNAGLEAQNPDHLLLTTRRLLVELQALSSRITAVQEIATAINRTLNLDEILQVVRHQVKWLLDFEHCSIYLGDEAKQGNLITLFGPTTEQEWLDPAESSSIRRAIQTRQSQLIREGGATDHFPYQSQIIIPLESESEILGTINFACHRPLAYTQEDLRIGYLLALQLAAAIRNARRFTEVNQLYVKLEQVYADLQQAEIWRNDLTHMIVHDLRNPLSVILGNLELMQLKWHDPAYAATPERLLNRACEAVLKMVGLIDDILDVSKFDAGELRPVLASVDMPALLKTREPDYHRQADNSQKSFTLHFSPNLPPVMVDAHLINRVLDNLISNALKYTNSGGRIDIQAELKDQAVWVSVRDDGEGIPPAYHQRIFDKFVQVTDSTGASLRKGTGLGLAFCRLAVEAHGGKIWVESISGQGSSFTFTLPV